ncbi:MAG: VanZ family protein [Isosphaeraceae bacterium]
MLKRSTVRTFLAWAATLVVIVLCLWPATWIPRGEKSSGRLPHLDKLIHFSMFAMFGAAWMSARPGGSRRQRWVAGVVAAGLALAVGTEAAQALPFVQRDPDPADALADATGLAVAVTIFAAIATTREPTTASQEV